MRCLLHSDDEKCREALVTQDTIGFNVTFSDEFWVEVIAKVRASLTNDKIGRSCLGSHTEPVTMGIDFLRCSLGLVDISYIALRLR